MIDTTAAYSSRADEYIDALGSMAAVHPLDRHIVGAWAESIGGDVLDAGCGPGHWTGFLADRGLNVRGVDAVPAFITHARSSYPHIRFDMESIDNLDQADSSLDGVLSWFSTIHHHPTEITTPLAEFARVLRPGGQLMLGFFSGSTVESFDHAVVEAYRWPAEKLTRVLGSVGFGVVEMHLREIRGERPVGALTCERA